MSAREALVMLLVWLIGVGIGLAGWYWSIRLLAWLFGWTMLKAAVITLVVDTISSRSATATLRAFR